jgi:CSLREA domain-containing protein
MSKLLRIFIIGCLLASSAVSISVPEASAATITVNTTDDTDYDTCDGTHCSLREAIDAANLAGLDTISFAIDADTDPGCDPGTGVCTIQPLDVLPALTEDGTTIDGYSQGDAAPAGGSTPAKLRVVLDGSSAPGTANGLIVSGSANHVIKGLVIHSFPQNGIYIHGTLATNVTVEGCYIGTDHLGVTALPNTLDGVHITLSANVNVIGGVTAAARNVISGNGGDGVDINTSANENMVRGNYIGTDAFGTGPLGNGGSGVMIQSGAQANLAGGATTGAGNVISANGGDGITLRHAATNDNEVHGNLIGLAADGATDLGNGGNGIQILLGAHHNIIGGMIGSTGNVISGNDQSGVLIWNAGSDWNEIQGNYIGTNASGSIAVPNASHGIYISNDAEDNSVGGTSPPYGNLISGNGLYGVYLASGSNWLGANYIGTDFSGYAPIPNLNGVVIYGASGNVIGGTYAGEGNLISGNTSGGVMILGAGATANQVLGNDIGVDSTGDAPLGNGSYGVNLAAGAHANTIGSATGVGQNQISGNEYGVYISDTGTNLNVVAGNRIGTNELGDMAVPNGTGVRIVSGAQDNTIGGSNPGEGNLISGNSWNGVFLLSEDTDGNVVCGNTIGLNQAGDAALPNGWQGVEIYQGPEFNVIGGSTAGCRNMISGNASDGVRITGATTGGNTVSGNWIGLDVTGALDRGNGANGVNIGVGTSNNVIGSETSGEGNVISGNASDGVEISGTGTNGNRVIGNYIGANASGMADVGNDFSGVKVLSGPVSTEIGGNTPGERNVIAGNGGSGISIEGSGTDDTIIFGNYIGLDQTGFAAIPNDGNGVIISNGPQGTVVGGDLAAERNIISGNSLFGVSIIGTGTTGSVVEGNYIGVNATGLVPVGNGYPGVGAQNNANVNTIGPQNLIAHNAGDGVYVDNVSQITITQNSIHSNTEQGIDLVAPANGGILQPSVFGTSPGSILVQGSGAPPDGTVEVFANPDMDGEGKTYLGSTTAGGSGAWSITVPCVSDRYLTATATDLAGNTSEFSPTFISTVTCVYLPLIMR